MDEKLTSNERAKGNEENYLFILFIIHFILIWLYSSSNIYKYIRLIYAK